MANGKRDRGNVGSVEKPAKKRVVIGAVGKMEIELKNVPTAGNCRACESVSNHVAGHKKLGEHYVCDGKRTCHNVVVDHFNTAHQTARAAMAA
jgi:hypothetical protein